LAFTLKYVCFRTAVNITVFWDVILCSLVKMTSTEDGDSLFFQVKVHFCQSMWSHIPEVIIFIVTSMRNWHLTAILLQLLRGFRWLQNSGVNPTEHCSWLRCLLDQKAFRTPSVCDLVVCKLTSSPFPLLAPKLEIVVEAQGTSERSNIFLKHWNW